MRGIVSDGKRNCCRACASALLKRDRSTNGAPGNDENFAAEISLASPGELGFIGTIAARDCVLIGCGGSFFSH